MNFFFELDPIYQASLAGMFTWFITILGASLVFFFKSNNKILDFALSFSGGVMLSASIFSLVIPALDMENVIIVSFGIVLGALFIMFAEKVYSTLKIGQNNNSFLLILSIFLHNIPEGLVIGVSYASVLLDVNISSAIVLSLGIGIQNFPEGVAVSLPLKKDGYSNKFSFFIGAMSAIVEPIFAFFGVLLSNYITEFLPFFLSFGAGAMIYVVFGEMMPSSHDNNKNISTFTAVLGFVVMMILDIILG